MDKYTTSTSETPKSKGGTGRHSTEERNIRGSPSSSTSGGKPLPNYLRASTGSCHDFCKYGKKHALEEETKNQFHRKLGKSRVIGEKQLEKKESNEEETMKKVLIKMKSSSFRRVVTSHTPETINRLHPSLSDGDLSKEKPAKDEMSPQEEIVLNEPAMIPASSKIERGQKIKDNKDDRRKQSIKPKTPVRSASIYKSDISTEINEHKNLLPDNASDPQSKSTAKEKNISGLQKATSSTKPRLVGQTSVKSHSTSYKSEISKQKSLAPLKTAVTAAKPDISLKALKAIKTSVAMPGSPLTPGSSRTRKDGEKTSSHRANSKMVERKGLKLPRTSGMTISQNATTTKNKGDIKCKQDDKNVEEKVAYVSEMKLNDSDMKYPQKKVQITQVPEEIPLLERVSLNSLEEELLSPRNVDVHLLESGILDSDSQQMKKSNNDQDDVTDNCQNRQQTNGDQSFLSVLDDKENSENLHQQQGKYDQSSPSVMESTGQVAHCDQQKLGTNHISEDDLSSQSISENDAEADNCQQHKSSDANQTSTEDHSASDYGDTDQTDSAHTESSQSEVEYEGSESNKNGQGEQHEERRRSRRTDLVPSEDSYSSPHKLKFRRGKVIELQPESNGPRRLRFRRARVVSDGGVSTHGRRHLRRNKMDDALPDDPNSQAETVVLRHKDSQEKKDSQGLFNNVIEETASKLVETRKSKVKALVGAFETVISLQDGKPASTT